MTSFGTVKSGRDRGGDGRPGHGDVETGRPKYAVRLTEASIDSTQSLPPPRGASHAEIVPFP